MRTKRSSRNSWPPSRKNTGPTGPTESTLVHEIALSTWRLQRIQGMEAGLIDIRLWDLEKQMDENYEDFDEHHRHGYVFLSDARSFNALRTLSTYAARAGRSFYKALHELERVRPRRAGDPVPPPTAIDVDVSIPENNNLEVPVEVATAPTDNLNKQSQSQNRTLPTATPLAPAPPPLVLKRLRDWTNSGS